MTLEQVVERVGKGVSRRRFLAKAGSVFLGATAAILGMPLAAQGLVCSYCCCVCYSRVVPVVPDNAYGHGHAATSTGENLDAASTTAPAVRVMEIAPT